MSLQVKEFWKSVNISKSYSHKFNVFPIWNGVLGEKNVILAQYIIVTYLVSLNVAEI